MPTKVDGSTPKSAWQSRSEEEEISHIIRTTPHDYILSIMEHRGTGGSFHVHKEILRRKSPMMAAWIEKSPNTNYFAMSNTGELALAMLILWMYDNVKVPSLQEVVKAWPVLEVKDAFGKPLPPGIELEFLEFMTKLQAYTLASRYVFNELKDSLSDATYDYFKFKLLASADKAKEALSAIFAHTEPNDQNLRSRVVALCASNKNFLDTTPQGRAVLVMLEINMSWTWITCLRTADLIRRDMLSNGQASSGKKPKARRASRDKPIQPDGLDSGKNQTS